MPSKFPGNILGWNKHPIQWRENEKGTKIIDIADVKNPIIRDSDMEGVIGQDMDIKEPLLFVSGHWYGLKIFNVSDPLKPHLPGALNDGEESNSSFLHGDKKFVSDSDSGLVEALDIKDPADPGKIMEFPKVFSHEVIFRDNQPHVVGNGLSIFKLNFDQNGVELQKI